MWKIISTRSQVSQRTVNTRIVGKFTVKKQNKSNLHYFPLYNSNLYLKNTPNKFPRESISINLVTFIVYVEEL